MVSHKEYYKGEGGGLPQVQTMVSLTNPVYACGSSMHQKCSNYALTNLLFGLRRLIWIIDMLVTCPSPHPKAPTHLSYSISVMNYEMCPNYFSFYCFHFGTHILVFQKVWGHHNWRAPNLLYRLKCESKVKIAEEQKVGARSLARNTSGVEGRAGAPGWGLRIMTSI
jgi:hypothetical protein